MFRFCIVLVSLAYSSTLYAVSPKDETVFDLTVSPQLLIFQEIFSKPSFAVMALQNSGLSFSQTMPVEFLAPERLRMGPADLEYTGLTNQIFHYKASLRVSLGVTQKTIIIPMDIDAHDFKQGKVKLILDIPLKKIIPNQLLIRLESKIRILAGADSQKKLIAYLNSDEISQGGKNIIGVSDRVALDYIRQIRAKNSLGYKDEGSSESLSEQLFLILSVLIWLVAFPVFLYYIREMRKRLVKLKSSKG